MSRKPTWEGKSNEFPESSRQDDEPTHRELWRKQWQTFPGDQKLSLQDGPKKRNQWGRNKSYGGPSHETILEPSTVLLPPAPEQDAKAQIATTSLGGHDSRMLTALKRASQVSLAPPRVQDTLESCLLLTHLGTTCHRSQEENHES